jgi:hypothetical protein
MLPKVRPAPPRRDVQASRPDRERKAPDGFVDPVRLCWKERTTNAGNGEHPMSMAMTSMAALSAQEKLDLLRLLTQDVLARQPHPHAFALYGDDGEALAYVVPAVLRPMTEVDLTEGLAELEDPDGHVPPEEMPPHLRIDDVK